MVEFENPSIVDFLSEYIFKNQEFYIPRLIILYFMISF